MRKKVAVCFLAIFVLSTLTVTGPAHAYQNAYRTDYYYCNWLDNAIDDVKRDYLTYYEPDNLLMLGSFLVASAIFANTGLDKSIQNRWQTDVRTTNLDRILSKPYKIGKLGYYYIPIYLSAMGLGFLRDQSDIGNTVYHWGYRSLRTMLLGGLQQLVLSPVLGSGRPDYNQSSKWQPFRFHNAVSGIAHYGAIPLLSAAYMIDHRGLRYGLVALSTLPGIAAINRNKNYFSQALLGWGIALLSANAVYYSDLHRTPPFQICLQPKADGAMLAASWEF